jgi:hypothetical protein
VPEYEPGPVNIQVYLDETDGWVLKLDPRKGWEGTNRLEFIVTDVDGAFATAEFNVTVTMEDDGIIDWGGGSGLALIAILAIVAVAGVASALALFKRRGSGGGGAS